MRAHQMFAVCWHLADEHDRARPHLERGGSRPAQYPWAYFGDPATEFATARRKAVLH